MKHPDSETLKELKDKAETDPMKAVDDLLDLVFNPSIVESQALP